MLEGVPSFDAAAALIDWWVDAGADALVGDRTRNWLAKAVPTVPAAELAIAPASGATTLAALVAELGLLPIGGVAAGARRVLPEGPVNAPVMLLTDLPAPEDVEEGRLVAGASGRLLDAMLAAIGLQRSAVYVASLSPARPASGRLDAANRTLLLPLARRHVALAAPRTLMLLGDCATAVMLEADCAAARGRWHDLNHGAGTVRTLATLHPRTLLAQPLLKRESWRDLRLLKEALQ